jgi:hypothetical protein
MVWKIVDNSDPGDADHHGGDSTDKISRLFSGIENVDVVDINSEWKFRSGKLKIRNPANDRQYSILAKAITSDYDLSLPLLTSADELIARVTAAELENKIIDATKNTLRGVMGMPDGMKTGRIIAGGPVGGNVGEGLFNGFIDLPAIPVRSIDPPPVGGFWRYNTGSVADTIAGIRLAQTITRKEFNPRFKTKIRVPSSTGHSSTRLYVGLNTDVVMEADDSPLLTTESGVIVGWRSTDSNFMVFRNSGTNSASASPAVVNTNVAKTTGIREIDIKFSAFGGSDGAQVTVSIIDPTTTPIQTLYSQSFTTSMPAAGFSMSPSILLQNSAAVARDFDVFYAFIEQRI